MTALSGTALELCFGIFGVLGVIITLATLHYRDSLCCVLFRRTYRFREPGVEYHELPSMAPTFESDARYDGVDLERGIVLDSPPPYEYNPVVLLNDTSSPSETTSTNGPRI